MFIEMSINVVMFNEALLWWSPSPRSSCSLVVGTEEGMAQRQRLPLPWPPGEQDRLSTGAGASQTQMWSGSVRRDQEGEDGAVGCGSTVRGLPVQIKY